MIAALFLHLASAAHGIELTRVVRCESAAWCIEKKARSGLKVSFLLHPKCIASTGGPSVEGTEVVNVTCPMAEERETVILDTNVRSYRKLEIKPVTKRRTLANVDTGIRGSKAFQLLSARAPNPDGLPSPPLTLHLQRLERAAGKSPVYVGTYTDDGEVPILVANEEFTAIADKPGLLAASLDAFEVNGTDALMISLCARGSDVCSVRFFELDKKTP